MTPKQALRLFEKYRAGTLTEDERAILEGWYLQHAGAMPDFNLSREELKHDLEKIYKTLPGRETPVRPFRPYWKISLAAASVLLFVTAGLFFFSRENKKEIAETIQTADVAPGGKKAVLTLADNTQVVLDDAGTGDIARQTGITVSKTTEGQLMYVVNDTDIPASKSMSYNTISTPKGGEYQVQLSDGTRVWLNSMSSIRFPVSFQGNERRVEIHGEAYFEVAHNPTLPFRVTSNHQIVEVLGTRFNINAYPDEPTTKTTLLQGAVRLVTENGKDSKVLKPGEQALTRAGDGRVEIRTADTEESVAWKNGYFIFADEELQSIMRKLERWYSIEVDYRDIDPHLKFGGAISRGRNLSEVLELLELTDNVKFKMEGKKVTVMP